ncbi:MAG: DUF1592 domain-containing protein [Myxococcota bacterium]
MSWLALLVGCGLSGLGPADDPHTLPETSTTATAEPTPCQAPGAPRLLRRLTHEEYARTVADLLGVYVDPDSFASDPVVDGFRNDANALVVGDLLADQYRAEAEDIAAQADLPSLLACDVTQGDAACATAFVEDFGLRAFRRPLTQADVDRYMGLWLTIVPEDGFEEGIRWVLTAMLQSPSFLYRVEVGAGGRFSDAELASRMSYLLWAGPPDDALLLAAEAGQLQDPDERRAQAERMLADPRARRGLRAWLDDWLGLDTVPGLPKDPLLFPHWVEGAGESAREQTLRTFEWLVFDADGDIRDVTTTRTTALDRTLAALYGVPAPAADGFAMTELPPGPRIGLLGQASFLARQAHSVSTSVTRRGLFVHTALLCREIPPPPTNVDTSIPEPSEDAPTMRDRVAVHLQDPMCASCHAVTDPVGLAFEQFDGIGRYRTAENGVTIDPSGELDGEPFADAAALGRMLHDHPDFASCLAETALRYAQGHPLSLDEVALAEWHREGLAEAGYRWQAMLTDIVAADGFGAATGEGR